MRYSLPRRTAAVVSAALLVAGLMSCSPDASSPPSAGAPSIDAATSSSAGTRTTAVAASSSLWDSDAVHAISLDVDDADLQSLLAEYEATGEKVWISASVTIDGQRFDDVGLKLKGNSSLRGTTSDSDPSTLPWIIRLDKYVDGQSYDGETELVVRANSSESSLNEAVALELLGVAGLATEEAIATRFSVNGSDDRLRLVIQNPNDAWTDAYFDSSGLLYKAEAEGDYRYRGEDPDSYVDVFDQEAGDDDLAPLISFLKFINESDDATFASELPDRLDVDAFATYLAFQDLIDNFDDIDGPGNNSYLYYDPETERMTVVNWDLNLAFGSRPGGLDEGGTGDGGPGQRPQVDGGDRPDGGQGFRDGGMGGPGGRSNVLAERFLANADFAALVNAARTELQAMLYGAGTAQQILDRWVGVLTAQAGDLVTADQVQQEAAGISEYFTS